MPALKAHMTSEPDLEFLIRVPIEQVQSGPVFATVLDDEMTLSEPIGVYFGVCNADFSVAAPEIFLGCRTTFVFDNGTIGPKGPTTLSAQGLAVTMEGGFCIILAGTGVFWFVASNTITTTTTTTQSHNLNHPHQHHHHFIFHERER